MILFILFTLSYISGMGASIVFDLESGGLFLLLTSVCLLSAAIPFWQRHSMNILDGNWKGILDEEESVPAISIMLIIGAFFCFGIFRYVNAVSPNSSNHISKVMADGADRADWRIVGRIIEEPRLRGDYLEVIVQPERAQEMIHARRAARKGKGKTGSIPEPVSQPDGDETGRPVDGGLVMALVYEENEAFRAVKFNQQIELTGFFSTPSARRNPGSLDYQQYLRNRGIFRTIRIMAKSGELNILSEDATGSWWYRFALYLRSEILKVIKQTMPYPESSFIGGVLLGLRGGLPKNVLDEFRMTGVSHVLAVSGLHVTIIAGLLFGIFTIFKVPLKVFSPLIVFSLFTFAMIVGWPSSAVRAALMNSLFILSRAYLKDFGFKLSIVFSLSVASFYILSMNPLQLTEPSFVLSVMAIYALAVFTDPSEKFLRNILRGNGLTFAAFMFLGFYLAVILKRDLCLNKWFFPGSVIYIICVIKISGLLSAGSTFQSFSYEMLPSWLQAFVAAQIAIFIAMMGPLSAFYFGQMSLAAPMANMLAIPLIGVIVQLALIAGLCGAFIPLVGIYIALLLNAANWLAVKFFLGMAKFFAFLIPFPRISQPDFGKILLYYALIHVVFYWETVRSYSSALFSAVCDVWDDPDYRNPLTLTVGVLFAVILFLFGFGYSRVEVSPDMRVTMLDVGFGASVMVEKKAKTLLIDAGLNDIISQYDAGERVILPALSGKSVRQIDAVILTSPLPEMISGLINILENYHVAKIYAPFPIAASEKELMLFSDYVERFDFEDRDVNKRFEESRIPANPPNYYWEQAYISYRSLCKIIERRKIPVFQLKKGDSIDGFEEVEVIAPNYLSKRFKAYRQSAILKISRGSDSIIYSSPNMYSLEEALSEEFDVLLLTDNPYPHDKFESIISKYQPRYVSVSFRRPSKWLMDNYYRSESTLGRGLQFLRKVENLLTPVYRTDKNGAFQVDFFDSKMIAEPFLISEKR